MRDCIATRRRRFKEEAARSFIVLDAVHAESSLGMEALTSTFGRTRQRLVGPLDTVLRRAHRS